MNSLVRTEQSSAVVHITLNRPSVLNAMNVALLDQLINALNECQSARAVVICGEGQSFSVGEDLRETLAPQTGEAEELRTSLEKLQQITRIMTAMPCPIVAAVQGYAIGGGAELALSADLVVAHPEAQFRFPEVAIGHAATGAVSARLPAAVGLLRAKELMLTGRWISGVEAHAIGMANELSEEPIVRASEWASELAQLPRRSVEATKVGLELAAVPNQEIVMRSEIDAAVYCFAAEVASEAYVLFQRESRGAPNPGACAEQRE